MSIRAIFRLVAGAAIFGVHANVVHVDPNCIEYQNCTATFNAAIESCAGQPYCTVALAAAMYHLDGPTNGKRININGQNNVAIVGIGPATVLLSDDISDPITINSGSNISFANFAIDMTRQPYTYGMVTAVGRGESTVTFDATQPMYTVNTTLWPWLNRAQGVLSYDPVRRAVAINATDIYALTDPLNITYISTTGTTAQFNISATLKLNDYVIVRHQTYGANAFSAYGVAGGISWSNINLWAVAGMGILTDGCSGGITIDSFRIERVGDRPMSITADGLHLQNTRGGGISITNCVFDGQGDDGLNTPTLFDDITWISSDRLSFVVEGRPNTGPSAPVVNAGDTVNFFNRSSMALLGSAVARQVFPSNGTVVLTSPLPSGVEVYALINNGNGYADYLTLTDNRFTGNRARGALIKTSNVYAARNVFQDCSGPAAKTETDGCYWYEGHPVTNWSFVDNIVTNTNFGPGQMAGDITIDNSVPVFQNGVPTSQCTPFEGSPQVQNGLNISGNTITQSYGTQAITVYSTNGLTIEGNTVVRTSGAPKPTWDFQGYGVVNSSVDASNTCDGVACKSTGL